MPCSEKRYLTVDLNLPLDVTAVAFNRIIGDLYIVESGLRNVDLPLYIAIFVRPQGLALHALEVLQDLNAHVRTYVVRQRNNDFKSGPSCGGVPGDVRAVL